MKEYVGAYSSAEIDPVYTIAAEDGKLMLRRLTHEAEALEVVASDLFYTTLGAVRFERDSTLHKRYAARPLITRP